MTEKEYEAGKKKFNNSREKTRNPAGYNAWKATSEDYLANKNKSSGSTSSSSDSSQKKSSSKDYKSKYRFRSYEDTDAYKENKKILDAKTEQRQVNITGFDRRDTAKAAANLNRRFTENKMKALPSPLKFPGKIKEPKLAKIDSYKLKGKNKESYLKGESFKPNKIKFQKPSSNNNKLKVKFKNPKFNKDKKRYTDLGVGIGKKTKKAK